MYLNTYSPCETELLCTGHERSFTEVLEIWKLSSHELVRYHRDSMRGKQVILFFCLSKAEHYYMFMDLVIKWKPWKNIIPPDLETLNVLFLVNIVENKRRRYSAPTPSPLIDGKQSQLTWHALILIIKINEWRTNEAPTSATWFTCKEHLEHFVCSQLWRWFSQV